MCIDLVDRIGKHFHIFAETVRYDTSLLYLTVSNNHITVQLHRPKNLYNRFEGAVVLLLIAPVHFRQCGGVVSVVLVLLLTDEE